jgi:hypothetical protein
MTLEQIQIALKEPGKLFDTGFDDCLEGRIPRFANEAYKCGYKLAEEMRGLRYEQSNMGSSRKD